MLAKKCDRCGKLYEQYSGKYENINGKVNSVALYFSNGHGYADQAARTFDLCPRCLEDAVKYLTDPDSEVV